MGFVSQAWTPSAWPIRQAVSSSSALGPVSRVVVSGWMLAAEASGTTGACVGSATSEDTYQ